MTVRGRTTPNSAFDGLDPIEKAAVERALNRCRALAAQIESELRNKRPKLLLDKASLAEVCASLGQAVDILEQKGRQPGENTPAPVAKQARHR